MKPVRLAPEVVRGLAAKFLDEFERTLGRVVADPHRWRKVRGENRQLNFHRFPYAIVYSVREDMLYIKAVMHLHRRPQESGPSGISSSCFKLSS